jgi:hypothetical protein
MKYLDYLYFNVYNQCYQASQNRQTFNPRLQAMYLCSLALGGWLLLLEAVYLHTVKHAWFSGPAASMVFSMAVYMLSAAFFQQIFVSKDRDLKIFDKYEKVFDVNPRKKLHLIFSVAVLFMPYLVLACHVIFFPKHH